MFSSLIQNWKKNAFLKSLTGSHQYYNLICYIKKKFNMYGTGNIYTEWSKPETGRQKLQVLSHM